MRQADDANGQLHFMAQIFTLFLIHAYSTRVWKRAKADNANISASTIEHGFQRPEGHDQLIIDGPWLLLLPCLLIWPFFEAAIGYGFIHNAVGKALLLVLCPLIMLCLPSGVASEVARN